MAFWKKKTPPRHTTLVGKHTAREVGEALAYGKGVRTIQTLVQTESETSTAIIKALHTMCAEGQGEAVVIIGDSTYYERVVETLPKDALVVFFQTSFAHATRLYSKGTPLPYITVYDLGFYDPTSPTFREGLVNLLHLGISCDAGLFDMVYSSFQLEKLLRRATNILQDMGEAEEAGSTIRDRLTFGYTLATPLLALAGGELTQEEALSIGMLWEATCGVKAGRVPLRLRCDLDGALSYLGCPRGYDIPLEDVRAHLLAHASEEDTLTLSLPQKKGTSAPFSLTLKTFLSLMEQTHL